MNWHTALNVVIVAICPTIFLYFQLMKFWRHTSRRWFIRRLAPDAPDIFEVEKAFESMEKVLDSMGTTMQDKMGQMAKSAGIKMPKMPKMPKLPDIKGAFEEWYDSGTGKWSPVQYGTRGYRTREAAETEMASLIIQDPKQMGKMEVVHV